MSREVKRVALDFEWPMSEVWGGFLSPDKFKELPCPDCKGGWSARASYLKDLWYGQVPFDPSSTGSTPLTHRTPAVRAFAERNVSHAPEFYGTGEFAIEREGRRLAEMWNRQWMHHLSQEDVNDLVEADDLRDFTHTWTREAGWQKIDPPVVPTAAEVNTWSITAFHLAHYSVIKAKCDREGVSDTCGSCDGHGSTEAYKGQRAEAEAWEPTEPPAGEGWQLWETVSEGSPISPVFPDAEGLAQWLTTPAACWGAMHDPMTIEQARGFVGVGWAPSMIGNAGGIHDGATYVGTEAALGER